MAPLGRVRQGATPRLWGDSELLGPIQLQTSPVGVACK